MPLSRSTGEKRQSIEAIPGSKADAKWVSERAGGSAGGMDESQSIRGRKQHHLLVSSLLILEGLEAEQTNRSTDQQTNQPTTGLISCSRASGTRRGGLGHLE